MDLLTPGYGLLIFQLIILSSILLLIISWSIILLTNKLVAAAKIVWLAGTLFLPVIGPILFLITFRNLSRKELLRDNP